MTYRDASVDDYGDGPAVAYDPSAPAPVEKKVVASTVTTGAVVALLTTILSLVEGDQLFEGVPDWVAVLVGSLLAAGSAFAAGRSAPHTARRDLPPAQR